MREWIPFMFLAIVLAAGWGVLVPAVQTQETATVEETPRFAEPSSRSSGQATLVTTGEQTVVHQVKRVSGQVQIDLDGDGQSEVVADLNRRYLELRLDDCPDRTYIRSEQVWLVDCG